mmetsp:Transcript_17559/g.25624  ORF Transcript_17559/g.25624 Transcript_17559/m.25624 type:complete len:222 (-) Transcript_17559:1194-1859(-)
MSATNGWNSPISHTALALPRLVLMAPSAESAGAPPPPSPAAAVPSPRGAGVSRSRRARQRRAVSTPSRSGSCWIRWRSTMMASPTTMSDLLAFIRVSRPFRQCSATSACASATRPTARIVAQTKSLLLWRTYVCSSRRMVEMLCLSVSDVRISSFRFRQKPGSLAFTKKSGRNCWNMYGRSTAMCEIASRTTYWISRLLRRMRTSALPTCCAICLLVGTPQ